MYYINYFFFYSIIGHFIESIIYLFYEGSSGILFGYWTPIYGVGSIFILYIYNKFIKNKNISKFVKYILVFLIGFIGLSLIELIGGILIEKIFKTVFWSYKGLQYNIGNYIALEISIIWGLASMLIVYIKKYLDKLIKIIPKYISITFVILFIFDIISVIIYKIFF